MINYRDSMESSLDSTCTVPLSTGPLNEETEKSSTIPIASHDKVDNKMTERKYTRTESVTDDTRSSLKQVYPYIFCLSQNTPIYCFILSVWDNIVGPQTVYVWRKGNNSSSSDRSKKILKVPTNKEQKMKRVSPSKLTSERKTASKSLIEDDTSAIQSKRTLNIVRVVKYVTEHTVGVNENNNLKSNKLISLLLNTPNQNIIVMSVKFSVSEENNGVPYCLSAVFPSHLESQIIPMIEFCMDSLIRITATCRLLITKGGFEGGSKIQGSLIELCDTLSSLQDAGLDKYPIFDLGCQPSDRRMAERMLTSTLQTMGTTLVVADSPSAANRVVMWLAQFISKEDLPISRIALSDYQWPYQPGIAIQAMIRDSSGGIDLSSPKLLSSKRPLTLIDLTSNTVRQMAPINVHSKNSETAIRQQLLALWHDLDHVPAPSHSLFESVESCSSLVKKFLDEWDRLSSCDQEIRKKFCSSFLRSLQYTALACIVWVKNQWPFEAVIRKPLFQVLLSTFQLEEPDLRVILAQAELLEPGFTSMVLES